MSVRYASICLLVLLTSGCLGPARLQRPLPPVVNITTVSTIEIADESGEVVASGRFSAPERAGAITSRVAALTGTAASALGSATLESASDEGALTESLSIELGGLSYPSLYRLRIDQKRVAVFSTTTSGTVSIVLSRTQSGG